MVSIFVEYKFVTLPVISSCRYDHCKWTYPQSGHYLFIKTAYISTYLGGSVYPRKCMPTPPMQPLPINDSTIYHRNTLQIHMFRITITWRCQGITVGAMGYNIAMSMRVYDSTILNN